MPIGPLAQLERSLCYRWLRWSLENTDEYLTFIRRASVSLKGSAHQSPPSSGNKYRKQIRRKKSSTQISIPSLTSRWHKLFLSHTDTYTELMHRLSLCLELLCAQRWALTPAPWWQTWEKCVVLISGSYYARSAQGTVIYKNTPECVTFRRLDVFGDEMIIMEESILPYMYKDILI